MIEYKLKDANNNTFSMNDESVSFSLREAVTQGGDSFSIDNKIIERSFLPGSVLVGVPRLQSRSFELVFPEAQSELLNFRDNINELIHFFRKTVKIEDSTNQMEITVAPTDCNVEYLGGSLKKYSDNTLSFEALNPYWEDLTADSETGPAVAGVIKIVPFTNDGFLESYPVITLVASVATNNVQIEILNENTGIEIQDNIFGTGGNLTMVIDCAAGVVTINGQNRNSSIAPGTGFFPLPVGSDNINILSIQDITYTIEWKKRYFV